MTVTGVKLQVESSTKLKIQLRVLLIEDNQLDSELILRSLRSNGYEVASVVVQDEAAFTKALRAHNPDVVLADYNLPTWKGMEAVAVMHREGLDVPLILVSGALGDVTAVECIKRGATDYVLKDGLARLPEAIRRALEEKATRQLRLEAERNLARKATELERSNADLEQFAYVASHDLQEPLRMVTAYTQLLAERYQGKLDADADKFIGYASEGAQRMQVLIQDLLAFSRVGRDGVVRREIECNAVMLEVLQTLSSAIQESGAAITAGALPTLWGDRTQLAQIFQNLIGNAIKFRQEKEPLIVAISAEKNDLEWRFKVTDNGIGIAPEHLENIFIVCTPARNIPATGLG
jgi:signal transduction histidine kinase